MQKTDLYVLRRLRRILATTPSLAEPARGRAQVDVVFLAADDEGLLRRCLRA